ncbi:hypothetical protein K3495_g12737 [Podosphaera aphanis]|nr:hypothetical protein K3495_g12737 [Podosphaera aphanis]
MLDTAPPPHNLPAPLEKSKQTERNNLPQSNNAKSAKSLQGDHPLDSHTDLAPTLLYFHIVEARSSEMPPLLLRSYQEMDPQSLFPTIHSAQLRLSVMFSDSFGRYHASHTSGILRCSPQYPLPYLARIHRLTSSKLTGASNALPNHVSLQVPTLPPI